MTIALLLSAGLMTMSLFFLKDVIALYFSFVRFHFLALYIFAYVSPVLLSRTWILVEKCIVI